MLKKKSCQICFQKYEEKWGEDMWEDGFVSCPRDAVPFKKVNGKPVDLNCPEVKLLKAIFSLMEVTNKPPHWCEFEHY